MQAERVILLLIAVILGLPLVVVLIVALWPYLPLVGKAIAGLIITCCVCGAITVCAWTWQRIRAPRLIVSGDVVVMLTRTGHVHLSAEHEAAKLLPSPRTEVTELRELSAEDREVIDRSRVLAAHFEEGKGMHRIEKELGISYDKVRHWINTAKALREKQQSW